MLSVWGVLHTRGDSIRPEQVEVERFTDLLDAARVLRERGQRGEVDMRMSVWWDDPCGSDGDLDHPEAVLDFERGMVVIRVTTD